MTAMAREMLNGGWRIGVTAALDRGRWVVIAVLLLAGFGDASAADTRWDPAAAFDEAAKLYERGQYQEATEAYDRLLTNGVTTAAVYFNRGNAYLKQGKTGLAIASYRVARLMAPRDREMMANLQFARSKVRGGLVHVEPFWSRGLHWFTPNEWAVLALLILWLSGGLHATRLLFPKLKESMRAPARYATLLAVLALVPLGTVAVQATAAQAVVIRPDAVARFGPLDDAQSAFTLPDGAEVTVTDTKGGWVEVRDLADRRGWVAVRDLVLIRP
ncbi:MAG: hypothetical protein JNK85_19380 [Verrucomicrobiales bacterium]|nr:hypothetical protein [Verrucomicrobiales bacterium]